jgi:hypothetical protein
MIFTKKKDKDVMATVIEEKVPTAEVVSETIAKRDTFFHSCWMALKQRRRDLWDDMTRVELYIAGYDDEEVKKEDKKKNDNPVIL